MKNVTGNECIKRDNQLQKLRPINITESIDVNDLK